MSTMDNVIYPKFGGSPEQPASRSESAVTEQEPLTDEEYDIRREVRNEITETIIGFRGLSRYCERQPNNYPEAFINKLKWLGMHTLDDPEHPFHDEHIFYRDPPQDGVTQLHPWTGVVVERFAANTARMFHELQYATLNDSHRLELLAQSLVSDFVTPHSV